MDAYPTPLAGVVETEIDGIAYVRTAGPVVVAVRGEQQLIYCPAEAWPDSPAAQHAARVARIATIEAELVELRAAAALPPLLAPPAAAAPKPRARQQPVELLSCPHCPKTDCRGRRGLMLHIVRAHPDLDRSPEPLAAPSVEPEPFNPADMRRSIIEQQWAQASALIAGLDEPERVEWRRILALAEDGAQRAEAGQTSLARKLYRSISDGELRASLLEQLDGSEVAA